MPSFYILSYLQQKREQDSSLIALAVVFLLSDGLAIQSFTEGRKASGRAIC